MPDRTLPHNKQQPTNSDIQKAREDRRRPKPSNCIWMAIGPFMNSLGKSGKAAPDPNRLETWRLSVEGASATSDCMAVSHLCRLSCRCVLPSGKHNLQGEVVVAFAEKSTSTTICAQCKAECERFPDVKIGCREGDGHSFPRCKTWKNIDCMFYMHPSFDAARAVSGCFLGELMASSLCSELQYKLRQVRYLPGAQHRAPSLCRKAVAFAGSIMPV